MSNAYYTATGNPGTRAAGASQAMRAEFLLIEQGFDRIATPVFPLPANKALVVAASGNAFETTIGNLALAGNFSTTGSFNTTLIQQASVQLTLPASNGTLATLAGAETLTNKTFVSPALGTPASGVLTNCTGTAAGLTAGVALAVVGFSGTSSGTNTGDVAVASAAEIRAGSNNVKTVSAKGLYDASDYVTLTYSATTTLDLSTFLNGTLTLTGNVVLANPSAGMTPGRSGIIRIVQDGGGNRLLSSVGSQWKIAGGLPTLSTGAGAIDWLAYSVIDATHIECSFAKGQA